MTSRVIAPGRAGRHRGAVDIVVVPTLLACGLVNLLPLAGTAGAGALRRLYAVTVTDPDLLLLLRHRALLLGLLGGALVVAAGVPSWRTPAVAVNVASMLAFSVLAGATPGANAASRRTARIDLVSAAALVAALALHLALPDGVG